MIRRTVLVVALALAFTAITPAVTASADPGAGHCKDADHLFVTTDLTAGEQLLTAPQVDIEVQVVSPKPADGYCVNAEDFGGNLYVFDINGNPGLRMYLDGPSYVCSAFKANAGSSVELQHTAHGDYTVFRGFNNNARRKLMNQLIALGIPCP